MPKVDDLLANIEQQELAAQKQEKYLDDDEQVETAQPKLKFSPELVIQSEQFLKKYCPNAENSGKSPFTRLLPTVSEFRTTTKLPISDKYKMLALAGAGSFDPTLDEDPNNPHYTQWVHDAMTSN